MPIYSYRCSECDIDIQLKLKNSEKNLSQTCQFCSQELKRVYQAPSKSSVMESGSKYHGKSFRKGMKNVLRKRARDHVIDNIGDLVDKYGLDTLKGTSYIGKNGKRRTVWDDK